LKTVVHSLSEKENNNDKDKAKLQAIDYMDDGSKICLCVEIDGKDVRRKIVLLFELIIVLFE
jgi:hypothetical protein